MSRNHIVSFRLTREERDRFRELCFSHGIPSISEMARAAINMMFAESCRTPVKTLESRVTELETRIDFLAGEARKQSSDRHADPAKPAPT